MKLAFASRVHFTASSVARFTPTIPQLAKRTSATSSRNLSPARSRANKTLEQANRCYGLDKRSKGV